MPFARFAVSEAKRVAKATLRVERTAVNGAPADPTRYPPQISGMVRAVVTTAIPTGTITAPAFGAANIYRWDSDAGSSTADDDPQFQGVKVWNDHTLSASIAVGKTIKLAVIDGDYWLVAADCP